MRGTGEIVLHSNSRPKVLLLGNGLLRLCEGISWSELLNGISRGKEVEKSVLDEIPFNMQAEAMCGTGMEAIRHDVACVVEKPDNLCIAGELKQLLRLDFDCILTTNYTYEVENVLLGKEFSASRRHSAIRTYGNPHKQTNLQICYEFITDNRKQKAVQVWHIHGDAARHNSLILSYYSYARVISELFEYSKKRQNGYEEAQQEERPLQIKSWLDWFIMGDVYSVGFGWDFSEIDLWWAVERKNREHAQTGALHCYFLDGDDKVRSKGGLLSSMGAKVTVLDKGDSYSEGYKRIIQVIQRDFDN